MNYRTLSIQELKNDYSTREGFVFSGQAPSNPQSCERLYKQIRDSGICGYEPDFINVINAANYAFVYPDGVYFNHSHSADFYEFCYQSSISTAGMFNITTLKYFLLAH